MSNLSNYVPDDSDTDAQPDEEKVTYVEISSVDHTEAYAVLSQGGAIRRNAPVNDLYAELTERLGDFFKEGDKTALLEWLLVDNEGELDRESIEELVARYE